MKKLAYEPRPHLTSTLDQRIMPEEEYPQSTPTATSGTLQKSEQPHPDRASGNAPLISVEGSWTEKAVYKVASRVRPNARRLGVAGHAGVSGTVEALCTPVTH